MVNPPSQDLKYNIECANACEIDETQGIYCFNSSNLFIEGGQLLRQCKSCSNCLIESNRLYENCSNTNQIYCKVQIKLFLIY